MIAYTIKKTKQFAVICTCFDNIDHTIVMHHLYCTWDQKLPLKSPKVMGRHFPTEVVRDDVQVQFVVSHCTICC